ncbi:hypothetical protein AcW2_004760 [Taiwanofungus camphoratus]|nr:hypothetical protein AcW2_004760 [Antrodia cinnamomea]
MFAGTWLCLSAKRSLIRPLLHNGGLRLTASKLGRTTRALHNQNHQTKTRDATSKDVAVGAFPSPPKFSSKLEEREFLKFRLAQALRIFGHLGYDEGVAGHISVRDCIRPDCFWVNPFGVHFSYIKPSDLNLVDHNGNIQDESGPIKLVNRAGFQIHSAIHAARPDVNCAAHSHSIHGRAFSTLGKELDMITQDSCAFYNDHAVYEQFGGIVLDDEEGKRIASSLGSKKVRKAS